MQPTPFSFDELYPFENFNAQEAQYVRNFEIRKKQLKNGSQTTYQYASDVVRELRKLKSDICDYNKAKGLAIDLFTVNTDYLNTYIHQLTIIDQKTGEVNNAQNSTKQRVYDQLQSFYSWCYKKQYIGSNPMAFCKRPVYGRQIKLESIYPDSKILEFFSALKKLCPDDSCMRDYIIARLIITLGCLPSEASELKFNQFMIDEDGQILVRIIRKEIATLIPIPEDLWDQIYFYIRNGLGASDSILQKDCFLFVSTRNMTAFHNSQGKAFTYLKKPINPSHLRQVIKNAGDKVEIDMSPMKLRNHHSLYALIFGANPHDVQDTTGMTRDKFVQRFKGVVEQLGKDYVLHLGNLK